MPTVILPFAHTSVGLRMSILIGLIVGLVLGLNRVGLAHRFKMEGMLQVRL